MHLLFYIIPVFLVLLITAIAVIISKTSGKWTGITIRHFNFSLQTVWDYISDIEGIPQRDKSVSRLVPLEKLNGHLIKWKEYLSSGGYRVFEKKEIPYQYFEKVLTESSSGITGSWIFTITGGEQGCVVTIKEISTVSNSMTKLWLVITGRDLYLRTEMKRIQHFVSLTSSPLIFSPGEENKS